MKARIESEVKIFGINFFIVSAAFTVAIIVLSIIAGNLLDFYPVSFEVVFPFFVTIVVGEWGKTRADSNFDTADDSNDKPQQHIDDGYFCAKNADEQDKTSQINHRRRDQKGECHTQRQARTRKADEQRDR